MENQALFLFSRNKYFFGKLLTQRDMEAEQDYFNHKRHLSNLIHIGPGVVCGFGVLRVDGSTVAVESGFALDGLGRELVISKPLITRLSDLEGFDKDRGISPYVYLCAEYAETPREPVHALTDGALEEDRFGRVEEGVRFTICYGEPQLHEIARMRPDDMTAGEWKDESLEKKLERGARVRLYLARINLVRWDEAYEIGEIKLLPFGQTADVPVSMDTGSSGNETEAPEAPDPALREPLSAPARAPEVTPPQTAAFGTVRVELPPKARYDDLYFSEEVPHGLGMTCVTVTLGLIVGSGAVFGDSSIFHDSGDYDWAVKTNDANGTFTVGIRVKTKNPDSALTFSWMAAADPKRLGALPPAPQILISPRTIRLDVLGSAQFSATLRGLQSKELVWSVREHDGGGITKDGCYIAPNTEGVFTIRATAASNPDVSGAAYVVVKKS